MNSIDQKQTKALIKFYERHLLPLQEAPETKEIPPQSADGNTYFIPRKHTRMRKQDFELRLADERQAAESLEDMWVGTPLSGLGKKLLKLSRRFPRVEEKAEVSSLIYEMF